MNFDKKNINIWKILTIIFGMIILILLFFKFRFSEKTTVIFISAIASKEFLSSIAGALIGGLIALYIATKDNKRQEKLQAEQFNQLQNFETRKAFLQIENDKLQNLKDKIDETIDVIYYISFHIGVYSVWKYYHLELKRRVEKEHKPISRMIEEDQLLKQKYNDFRSVANKDRQLFYINMFITNYYFNVEKEDFKKKFQKVVVDINTFSDKIDKITNACDDSNVSDKAFQSLIDELIKNNSSIFSSLLNFKNEIDKQIVKNLKELQDTYKKEV
ncbi:YtxH domain-containing protein [Streptococcus porcinus]|uniref:Uncharacterized protein n=1 Tax=Streptococcus porcinus TaxID=1340 RepID=A0A4V0HBC5_STRPO|nr:YtxH domain-containing protein [Streptococcus porcinus]VTT44567.1 Uncharacterised protein [Streptococcus porcinus]VTT45915.1 Uncharacterised protein [Streptococcus porcinus]